MDYAKGHGMNKGKYIYKYKLNKYGLKFHKFHYNRDILVGFNHDIDLNDVIEIDIDQPAEPPSNQEALSAKEKETPGPKTS